MGRNVRYTGDLLSNGDRGYLHTAGSSDESPQHMTYPTGYDSRCGWCYLNAPHTEDAHTDKVAAEAWAESKGIA